MQSAEQLVSGAWISELHQAADDADLAVRACLHLRAVVLQEMRTAQSTGDLPWVVRAQAGLEAAEHDLADSIATRDGVRDLLARELADRPCAVWVRVLPEPPGHASDGGRSAAGAPDATASR